VTVPNDTDDGVEVNDAAWDLAGPMTSANSAAGTTRTFAMRYAGGRDLRVGCYSRRFAGKPY